MDKYAAARAVNLLLTILGWATILLAALVVFGVFGRPGPAVAITVALPIALGGLVIIAVAQIASAQLDTAENTTRMADDMAAIRKRLTTKKTTGAGGTPSDQPFSRRRAGV
ncbi:hypothetical protein [Pararhodobacter zhoushanensis]|uniref:DUF4229 domain-containing protein n=1 Tax=Pararhodobacter zhoushanensis TaxID=2479545 RepID=A0ABT3H422_9RHOB|nr:hypothetical protein [Pararhodobacter zhoushanensis]MCW1934557.1 hypothetical protein [Pararhodobacter zhoushanensis]